MLRVKKRSTMGGPASLDPGGLDATEFEPSPRGQPPLTKIPLPHMVGQEAMSDGLKKLLQGQGARRGDYG